MPPKGFTEFLIPRANSSANANVAELSMLWGGRGFNTHNGEFGSQMSGGSNLISSTMSVRTPRQRLPKSL